MIDVLTNTIQTTLESFDFAVKSKMPTTRNSRIFEVAKELLIYNGTLFDVDELVNQATKLVDKVGIETE